MKHRIKFIAGLIVSIPLLPIIFFQGKKIRKEVPRLPEAEQPEGILDLGFQSSKNILFLGESTVAGVGVRTHKEGFAGSTSEELARLFQKNLNWKVVARSGYTANLIRTKLLRKIGGFEPDLIILGLGGNDAFTLNNPWKWRKQIVELIRAIQLIYSGTPIVFTNMPPIKEFPAFTGSIKFVVGNLIEILGTELNILKNQFNGVFYSSEVIRIEEWIHLLSDTQKPSDFFSDGVHPSKLTYQTWGKEIARFIYKSEVKF